MTGVAAIATAAAPRVARLGGPASVTSSAALGTLLAAALAVCAASCLLIGWQAPLWLDETFTLAIVTQPSLGGFAHSLANDVGGPLYYVVLRTWVSIAGASDTALRLPSAAFLMLAPILALWGDHADTRTKRIWAALIATWTPGLLYASEARGYALAMLLATAQAVAYLRLLAVPRTRAATVWAILSSALIATHFHGVFVTAIQGALYFAWHRKRTLRTWPAAAMFLPIVAWMAVALPTMRHFSGVNSWYRLLRARDLGHLPELLFGSQVYGLLLMALVLATWAVILGRRLRDRGPAPYAPADMLLAASGVAAVMVVIGMGFVVPCFTPRYVIPTIPALLFAVAMWSGHVDRRWPRASAVLIACAIGIAVGQLAAVVARPERDRRYNFSLEAAARRIADSRAGRMLIAWDSPPGRVMDDGLLRALGATLFDRAERPMTVIPIHLATATDPNPVLLAEARRRDAAFIWLYDVNVPRTAGAVWPARISAINPRWRCTDDGRGGVHVVACLPPGA